MNFNPIIQEKYDFTAPALERLVIMNEEKNLTLSRK
jgi:hypothetical protein